YSPVRDERGTIVAMMNITSETTRSVVDRRHLRVLGELRQRLSDLASADELPARALACLLEDPEDFPAVDVRLPGAAPRDPRLPVAPAGAVPARGLLVEDTPHGRVAWLSLGRPTGTEPPPLLVVLMSPHLAHGDEAHAAFLRLIASSLIQALDRVTAREAERSVAVAERGLSEALQRSVLTAPLQPDHLRLAVHYEAAAEQAQIGGDWYDAFMLPDGALAVAIGDIAGHDQEAAAAMAQVRNLLRGIAYTRKEPPAQVLVALDEAMNGLAVNAFATAIFARVEQDERDAEAGLRTLRWSNAGHPPPVLLRPDGTVELLERTPNLLLGLGLGRREDHTVTLEPGASVVFYTDGLVERRGVPLEEGFAWLLGALRGRQDDTAEELAALLTADLETPLEDDLALLVLHAHPEDRPLPPEVGPEILPQ
ncbi:MAG: serine/threonine-protein phosphatase, partial [Solirubrobacterales bacterium]|nr:serine/threonine-protein phosphatase [Solirubrobacterales bacterium]